MLGLLLMEMRAYNAAMQREVEWQFDAEDAEHLEEYVPGCKSARGDPTSN